MSNYFLVVNVIESSLLLRVGADSISPMSFILSKNLTNKSLASSL